MLKVAVVRFRNHDEFLNLKSEHEVSTRDNMEFLSFYKFNLQSFGKSNYFWKNKR
jgi:hypothetical protein